MSAKHKLINWLWLLLIILVSVVTLNYFLFDFTALVLCDYKSISESEEKLVSITQENMRQIAERVWDKPEYAGSHFFYYEIPRKQYEIKFINNNSPFDTVFPNDKIIDRLYLSRSFGSVPYNLWLSVKGSSINLHVSTYNFNTGYDNGSIAGGEMCIKSNFLIRKNLERMLDEMELTPDQKAEILSKIKVSRRVNWNINFL
jgi:hypothetical protein